MEKLMYSSSNELRTAWSGAEQNKPSLSYHEAELKELKKLIKEGHEPEFAETNHWMRINGRVFNGVTRCLYERIVREVSNENS